MFPKDIQKIIETYGEDMAILEELQKLKHSNEYLIRLGDAMYLSSTFGVLDRTISLEENIIRRLLIAEPHFQKSPAGWVYRKIDTMEWRRLDLWIDCNLLSMEYDDIGNFCILDSRGKPIKEWSPFLEKFKSKFMMWTHYDTYKVGEWLDNRVREQELKDQQEEDDHLIGPI